MTSAEAAVLRAMAEVSETLLRIAGTLRAQDSVRRASSVSSLRAEEPLGEEHFRVGSGDGFRQEWYTEGEFVDGRTLTFSQEAAWHDGEWVVDASIRGDANREETFELELPRRHAVTTDEAVDELRSQARLLESLAAEAIRNFRESG